MEVAGLVLGAIPIVISALECYEQGMAICRRYKRHHREFKNVRTSLSVETFKYRDVCTKILSQSFQDHEIRRMLNEPHGDVWKDPRNMERLRRQLGDDCLDIFLIKSEDIYTTLNEFRERLKLHEINQANLRNPSLFEEHYKRLRFSLSRKDYEDLLARLRRDNLDLNVLTSPTALLDTDLGSNAYPSAYIEGVRECVRSTYTSLKSHWQCGCKHLHKIILQLGRVDAAQGSSIESYSHHVSQQPCFHVIFSYGKKDDLEISPNPWDWTDLKLLSTFHDPVRSARNKPGALNAVDNGGISHLQNKPLYSKKQKKKKTIRFADEKSADDSLDESLNRSLEVMTVTGSTNQSASITSNQILCICDTLSKQSVNPVIPEIGYMLDRPAKRRHDLMFFNDRLQLPATDVSLHSLDSVFATPRCAQKLLPRRLRMRLATILSMSVLEFGETPWTDAGWSKKDIMFVQQNNTPCCEDMFVAQSMVSATTVTPARSIGFVRNRALFALGILLIELCFGKPAEQVCKDYDVPSIVEKDGSPKFPPDYNNIKVLLQAVAEESDDAYSSAVRRCLHCSFDCNEDTLEYDEFRRAVYSGVVLPLETNYRHMSGHSVDAVHSAR